MNNQKDLLMRALHTFWQTFAAVFLAGATGLLSNLLNTHNFSDAKSAVVALVISAIAAAASAVKTMIVQTK